MHRSFKSKWKKQKAIALIFVLIAIISLTAVLSSIHLTIVSQIRTASLDSLSVDLYNLADGAIREVLEKLRYDLLTLGGGSYLYRFSVVLNNYKPVGYDTNAQTNSNPEIPYIFTGPIANPQSVTYTGNDPNKKYLSYIFDNDKFRNGNLNSPDEDEGAGNYNLISDLDRKIRVLVKVYNSSLYREYEAIVEVNKPFNNYGLMIKGDALFNENSNTSTIKTSGTNADVRVTGHIYIADSVHDYGGSINSSNNICCPLGCGSYTMNGSKPAMVSPVIDVATYWTNFFRPKCNTVTYECYSLYKVGMGVGSHKMARWQGSWSTLGTVEGNPSCNSSTDLYGWCFDMALEKWIYDKSWQSGSEIQSLLYSRDDDVEIRATGTSTSPHYLTIIGVKNLIFDDGGNRDIFVRPYEFNQAQYKDCNNFLAITNQDLIVKVRKTSNTIPNFGGNSRGAIIMAGEQMRIDRSTVTSDSGPWIKGLVYVENDTSVSTLVTPVGGTDSCGVGYSASFTTTVDSRPIFTYFGGLNPFPKEVYSILSDNNFYNYDLPEVKLVDVTPLF